jgi:phage tail-like protein
MDAQLQDQAEVRLGEKIMLAVRVDPYLSYRFLVEIDSTIVGGFSEISGLQAETQVEDYREGGVNDFVHKLTKETTYPNLILKRGITDSSVLWNWYRDVVSGTIERKNVYILLLDSEGQPTWTWNILDAHPIKWVGPELTADGNTVAFESIELVHKGFNWV